MGKDVDYEDAVFKGFLIVAGLLILKAVIGLAFNISVSL